MLVRIVEVQGQSDKNWDAAVQDAVQKATGQIGNVTGVRVMNMTGTVRDGAVTEYKADVKIAYVEEA